jgi:hypothetical protein
MMRSPEDRPEHRYISELVWLPTYLGITAFVLGTINDSTIASVALLVSLVMTRMALELLYRIALGETRLEIKTGLIALACQVLVWGLIFSWHFRSSAPI